MKVSVYNRRRTCGAFLFCMITGGTTATVAASSPDYLVGSYIASSTDDALTATTDFPLGTYTAGTTLRVGTCSANGDLPSAAAVGNAGDTFLRLGYWSCKPGGAVGVKATLKVGSKVDCNWVNLADNDNGGPDCGGNSYIVYNLPSTMTLTLRAGCSKNTKCSARIYKRWDLDGNGGLKSVVNSFVELNKNRAPLGDTIHMTQNGHVPEPYDYNVVINRSNHHFQGVQRLRVLTGTGHDNAGLQDGGYLAVSGNSSEGNLMVAKLTNPADASGFGARWTSSTPVISQSFFFTKTLPGPGEHIGGMQAFGRYLALGIEDSGVKSNSPLSPGVSDLMILRTLPSGPEEVAHYHYQNDSIPSNGPMASAGCVGLVRLPGQTRANDTAFIMVVGDYGTKHLTLYRLRANAWGLASLDGSAAYPATPTWEYRGYSTMPSGIAWKAESCNLVAEEGGNLFLITTRGDTYVDPPIRNKASLWQVFPDKINTADFVAPPTGLAVNVSDEFNSICSTTGHVSFIGAAGVYVDPAIGLEIYSMHPFRPEGDGDVVKMKRF
jgi:hypothetical protein